MGSEVMFSSLSSTCVLYVIEALHGRDLSKSTGRHSVSLYPKTESKSNSCEASPDLFSGAQPLQMVLAIDIEIRALFSMSLR